MQIVHFTPPELARRLGVNESTVKRWIDRGMLEASVTSGGHRRIREEHLRAFIEKNPKLRAKSYALRRFHKAKELGWEQYFSLQRTGEFRRARTYLETSFVASGNIRLVLEQIVAPTLREIGEAWIRGELDILDEHRMSFCVRSDLIALQALLPAAKRGAPRALLACVPGENHELALILLSLRVQAVGWQPIVLGINVPFHLVPDTVARHQAAAVCLVKLYGDAPPVDRELATLRAQLPSKVKLFVGGTGWSDAERRSFNTDAGIHYHVSREELVQALGRPLCRGRTKRSPLSTPRGARG